MRFVTHYVPRPPEPDAWAQVAFFTQEAGDSSYLCGFDHRRPLSQTEIENRVAQNAAERLHVPIEINETKRVWISPERAVWVADAKDPLGDDDKILAKRGIRPTTEESVVERIAQRAEHGNELICLDNQFVPGKLFNAFVGEVVARLSDKHHAIARRYPEGQLDWDLIPNNLLEGIIDFCYDPYFLSKARSEQAGVVQFGTVDELTLYVASDSPLYRLIVQGRAVGKSLREILTECNTEEGVEIGLLSDTVSTSELKFALRGAHGVANRLVHQRDPVELRVWIDEDPQRRLIVGDIGLPALLNAVGETDIASHNLQVPNEFMRHTYIAKTAETRFPMTGSYPAGFIYPARDLRWKREIENAVSEVLKKLARSIQWDEVEGVESSFRPRKMD